MADEMTAKEKQDLAAFYDMTYSPEEEALVGTSYFAPGEYERDFATPIRPKFKPPVKQSFGFHSPIAAPAPGVGSTYIDKPNLNPGQWDVGEEEVIAAGGSPLLTRPTGPAMAPPPAMIRTSTSNWGKQTSSGDIPKEAGEKAMDVTENIAVTQKSAMRDQSLIDEARHMDTANAQKDMETEVATAAALRNKQAAEQDLQLATVKKQVADEVKEIQNWQVDQGRAFKNPVRKGMAVIAGMLESLSHGFYRMGGVNPGPKTVMRTVQNIIDQDIQAQLKSLENKKYKVTEDNRLVAEIYRRKGNIEDTYLTTRAILASDLKNKISVIQSRSNAQSAAGPALQIAYAEADKMERDSTIALEEKMMQKTVKTSGGSSGMQRNPDWMAYMKGQGKEAGKPLTQKDRDALIASKGDIREFAGLEQLIAAAQKSSPGRIGRAIKATDSVSALYGGSPENRVISMSNALTVKLIRAMGDSRPSNFDAEQFRANLPLKTDTIETAVRKVKYMRRLARETFDDRAGILNAQGFNLAGVQ